MSFQTEFEFELPRGYVDQNGEVHKRGVMRLATACLLYTSDAADE